MFVPSWYWDIGPIFLIERGTIPMIGLNAEFLSMQKIKDSKNIVKRQNGRNKVMAFKSYHRLIKVPIQNLKFILKASTKLQSQNPDQT